MSLRIIGLNKHGEIVFCREDEDGTAIVLTCEDLASIDDVMGPVIVPRRTDADAEPLPDERGVFPVVPLAAYLSPASSQPLVVDISEMPQGLLVFNPGQLTRGGLALLEAGETRVALSEQSAREFGFTRVLSYQRALGH